MKKFMAIALCLLLSIPMIFANGESEQAQKKEYVIKLGHSMTTQSPRHQALLEFKSYVEAQSNGQIKVELFPAGVLGKEAEMVESLKMGNLEAYVGGPFDALTEKLNLILMPFFFDSQESLMKVAHSDLGAQIMDDAKKNNIKILAFGNGGSRNITNNVREIKTPADMAGIKLRTPPMKSIIECMKSLGANPVSIPYADTYMALKTGVADGQENPLANIVDMKFYEVQKYMTYINYQFHPEVLSMNLNFFNNLPQDLQKICVDGGWVFANKLNEIRKNTDQAYYNVIKDSGVKIYTPTADEVELFREACAPVYDYFINEGSFTQAELDQMRTITQGN
jgi:C4-dicarboxylate-binding protein DctP